MSCVSLQNPLKRCYIFVKLSNNDVPRNLMLIASLEYVDTVHIKFMPIRRFVYYFALVTGSKALAKFRRERLAVSKQTTHRFHMERLNLKKLNEVEDKEQYRAEISKRFAVLENLDAYCGEYKNLSQRESTLL
jgi:hypothetical protein